MKCDGGYYEEAAKFADDYAELKKRQRKRRNGIRNERQETQFPPRQGKDCRNRCKSNLRQTASGIQEREVFLL